MTSSWFLIPHWTTMHGQPDIKSLKTVCKQCGINYTYTDSSWQSLVHREPSGFIVCLLWHLYRQSHFTFQFTFLVSALCRLGSCLVNVLCIVINSCQKKKSFQNPHLLNVILYLQMPVKFRRQMHILIMTIVSRIFGFHDNLNDTWVTCFACKWFVWRHNMEWLNEI